MSDAPHLIFHEPGSDAGSLVKPPLVTLFEMPTEDERRQALTAWAAFHAHVPAFDFTHLRYRRPYVDV